MILKKYFLNIPHHWWNYGFWNTLEHALTRIADALTSILLIWVLAPEVFSKLAFAQALIAPFLFLFINPETVLYRDFSKWKEEGARSLDCRLRALRLFGWSKGILVILLSVGIAFFYPDQPLTLKAAEGGGLTSGFWTRFFSLNWAFFLILSPQLSGTDREFLRLSLKLKSLNAISLFQKISTLGGTALIAWLTPHRFDLLAAVTFLSALATACIAYCEAQKVLYQMMDLESSQTSVTTLPQAIATLREAFGTFSVWSHLSGVITQWVQTLDLFFLGIFQFPARTVGLYAIALKLANFSTALPMALSNLFSIRIGRNNFSPCKEQTEIQELNQFSIIFFVTNCVQGALLALLGPWLLALLSRGRWSTGEQGEMLTWFFWILAGTILWSSTFPLSAWISVRRKMQALFLFVYLPWGLLAFGLYGILVPQGGPSLAAVLHFCVSILFWFLLKFLWKHCHSNPARVINNS